MARLFGKTMGIVMACLFVALGPSAWNPQAMAADTIKIGQLDPISGPFEVTGRVYYAGIKFAVDEVNKKGGLLGKKVEIIQEDSELKPDVANRKAKKLILESKVNFLGSGTGTHISIALNKVATSYKTLFINYGALSEICQGKEFSRNAFRVCHNNYSITSALVQLMATKPYRKYYILCQDYAYGHDAANDFKKKVKMFFPEAQIVGEDFHPLATKDFGPYINKVIAAKADVIFSANYSADGSNLIKQARALGLKVPFPFAMPYAVSPYTEQELKDDAVGIHFAFDYTMRVDTPENKAMIERYRTYHKDDKDVATQWCTTSIGHTALGWMMVFAAVEKAGTLDPEKFIAAFEGFSYKTPVGTWTMRACDHQVIQPMFGGTIEGGPNPFFPFPWIGPKIVTFPAEKVTIPATSDYNPRCK
jgi:branched-chain amino acid transport system substrate-binding protein